MAAQKLWYRGNLFTGYPFGVEVEKQFGSSEVHGPFSSENEAWNYGMALAKTAKPFEDFTTVKVVRLETPQVKVVTTAEAVKEAREDGLLDEVRRDGPETARGGLIGQGGY